MKRFASVRFDGEFAASERAAAARTLRSAGASVTSWNGAAGRTYASALLAPETRIDSLTRYVDATVNEPPLIVLRVVPDAPRRLGALEDALGGAGRPRGVLAVLRELEALVVEIEPRATSLALIVATIDHELTTAPGRTIEPLVELDDETLVAFAGHVLHAPDLDPTRLIETYLEPLLVASSA